MSTEPDFEKRINNKIETILETQANLQEAVAGMVLVARTHDEQIDRNTDRLDRIEKQMEENSRQIKENSEQIAALIRILEGHLSGHP